MIGRGAAALFGGAPQNVDENAAAQHAGGRARRAECKYTVRETPGEITYYRLANGEVEVMGAKRLSPYEQLIIRMYEAEQAQAGASA